jgi:hypothetical protein
VSSASAPVWDLLDGSSLHRPEVTEWLWQEIPSELRLERYTAEAVAHPAFSWGHGLNPIDLSPLPAAMRRELAWCVWRAIEQGGHIHAAYSALARRLTQVIEDLAPTGPQPASLMDLALAGWERALRKTALRRGQRLSGLKPIRWALRSCYRLLHLAYDPRDWWEHEVWDRRLDARIPVRVHEPTAKTSINFALVEQSWLRRGLQWHGKVGLETGQLRWSTVCERMVGMRYFARYLAMRGVDHPALAQRPAELRALALDFLGYLRSLRVARGPNRGRPFSDSHLVHVMCDVEQFYAFMADYRHEAANRLADHRWRYLGEEHSRLWRPGEKPSKSSTPPEAAYLDDTAMSQIMAHVHLLADPPSQGGMGDEQAMRLLMLLALTGRRVSELALLEFHCLLPLPGLTADTRDPDRGGCQAALPANQDRRRAGHHPGRRRRRRPHPRPPGLGAHPLPAAGR